MPYDIMLEDLEVETIVDNDIDDDEDAENELLGDDGGEGIADSDAIDIVMSQDGDEEFCYEADVDSDDLCCDEPDDDDDEEPDGDEDDDSDEDELDDDIDDENQNEYENYDNDI